MKSFPGSVLLESTFCGTVDHTEDHSTEAGRDQERLWKRGIDQFGLCSGGSPSYDATHSAYNQSNSSGTPPRRQNSISEYSDDNEDDGSNNKDTPMNATSALFARALVSEVTDNPKTMTPAAMAEREKKLLRAQQAAKKNKGLGGKDGPRPVGAPGGIGQPNLLGSIAQAIRGGGAEVHPPPTTPSSSIMPPNSLQENRAQQQYPTSSSHSQSAAAGQSSGSKYSVTIGLSLSRRHSTVGHPDTVTRQTAFDFNELQDRQYKYVSSTDSSGWRAGGGERGGDQSQLASAVEDADALVDEFGNASLHPHGVPRKSPSPSNISSVPSQSQPAQFHKIAAPDTVHIPIIQIDAESPQAIDAIISALARGEIFIPHMAVLPESLSVNGISPPDLVVRFGCERNDDVPPDEWPNWCLEFMHNQLYEYFHNAGVRWMKRPFSITLARKVRWKTVKHMNRYFAHAERVIDAWREKGPQYLDPQLSYIEGGATPEEVARPHGLYLFRNGVPTNYFAPNFDPPYTTKMTRSLLLNVLGKSWDKKRREWTTEPIPRLVTPSMFMAHVCGCADPSAGGFMANEVTHVGTSLGASHLSDQRLVTLDQHQPKQKQQLPQDYVTGATASNIPATPAGIVPASSATPHSITSTDDYSAGSRSRRKQKAPHMHQPTAHSSSQTAHGHIVVPTHQHMKSPVHHHEQASPSSSVNQEEKKIDDDCRRQRAEAPGKYMTFRADGQTIQDPPPAAHLRGSGQQQLPTQSGTTSGTVVIQDNNLVASVHRVTNRSEPKQTIQNDKHGAGSKKGRDRHLVEGGAGMSRSPRHSPSVGVGQGLPNSDTGISLEYSMDSSSMLQGDASSSAGGQERQQPRSAGVGGGSMMMQFAEASVSSNRATIASSSKREEPRGSTRKAMEPQRQKPQQQQPVASVTDEEETLSLQDSGSSSEIVPTDEDLFVVGWAKALDPSSGNYYYFTLDRTKTVWENPLSADTYVSEGSSYFSGSGRS